jgi:hypothetical protein
MIERGSECRDLSVPGGDRGSLEEWSGHPPRAEDAGGGCAAPGALAGGRVGQRLGDLAASQVRSGLPRWAEGHRAERSSRGDSGLHQSLASVVPSHGGRGAPERRTTRTDATPERGAEGGTRDHHRGWSAGRGLHERDVDRSDDPRSHPAPVWGALPQSSHSSVAGLDGVLRAASAQAARSRGCRGPGRVAAPPTSRHQKKACAAAAS